MKPRCTPIDGYTLIELIVVLLLLSMIALTCEGGLRFGAQVWEHAAKRTQIDYQTVSSQNILRELLVHSLPRTQGMYITFAGEPTAMSFDLIPPQAFREGGTAHAQLRVTSTSSKGQLVLDMQSISNRSFKRHAILLGNAGTMRFSYLDATGKSQTWLSYWRDKARLPDAIRLTSDLAAWPILIVRPVVVQSATCVEDSVDLTCRKI